MHRLTKEQYLENLLEVRKLKSLKYENLGRELRALDAKILKIKSSPATSTTAQDPDQGLTIRASQMNLK